MNMPMMMPMDAHRSRWLSYRRRMNPEFDRLFLTFMIQHHSGGVNGGGSVVRLAGAAQDDKVFKFASDAEADQDSRDRPHAKHARSSHLGDALAEEGRVLPQARARSQTPCCDPVSLTL